MEEASAEPVLCITVDVNKAVPKEEDIFADIFNEDECVVEETPEISENITTKDEPNKFAAAEDIKQIHLNASKLKKIETDEEDCVIPETPPVITKEENNKTYLEDSKVNSPIKCKKEDILSILSDLKQQVSDVKNINLDEIKLSNSIIELSDDEQTHVKQEIIEICDSDDNQRPCTPPLQRTLSEQSPKPGSAGKSPKFRTPSKNHAITEFFNVNYVVKRTPDKPPTDEEDEGTSRVKSPFFVKKTPKSTGKSGSNSPSSDTKISKASKSLFEQKDEGDKRVQEDEINDAKRLQVSEDDIINEAAELLKSTKTSEELDNMAVDLAKERRDLENERNRQDRMSMSITQRMNSDCQELLRLFGVPYIVAPMEAEAQCAFLDIIELTNGTITDDSDIWLFGGRTVYKNFFAQNKHVMEFRSDQIEKNFNCDRHKLIQLACLVGSDYTTGKK